MTDPNDELLVERSASVCTLRLNRPRQRNALSQSLLDRLESTIQAIAVDRQVRVVVIASTGPVFCAGHDLGEMTGRDAAEYERLFSTCARVMLGLRTLPQPVVARVQGMATAAGCQLVAASDLAVASHEARFATPGVRIGLFCTTPMVPLVRKVPAKIAMEMLLTGEPIDAEQALQAGLVNRVVPADQLDAAVQKYVEAILSASAEVIALGKRAFYDQWNLAEDEAYRRAVDVMSGNAQLADAQEGMTAFLEKRSPRWPSEPSG